MKRFRLLGLCLVAVFAIGAVGTTLAMAADIGPYLANRTATLAPGANVNVTGKLKSASGKLYVPALKSASPIVECTAASGKGEVYNEYIGGALKEGRLKNGSVVFTGCTVTEAPECSIGNESPATITASNIVGRLGNTIKKPGSLLGLIYTNAAYFTTIKFTGSGCSLPKTNFPVTGGVIGTGSPINAFSKTFVINAKVTAAFEQELKEIEFSSIPQTLTNQHLALGTNAAAIAGELELETAEELKVVEQT